MLVLSAMLVGTLAVHVDSSPLPQKTKQNIVGKWDSRIRSNDSSLVVEFSADGSFKQHSVLEKEGRYSIKDNQLTTYVWDDRAKQDKKRIFDVTLDADQLTMKDPNASEEIRLDRTCKIGGQAELAGEWFSANYPGAIRAIPLKAPLRFPAFVEFTKDKKLFFRSIPIRSRSGQYEYSGGVLVLKISGDDPLQTKPHVSSDQIDLKLAKNGPEIPFRRVLGSDCGIPYDVNVGP